MQDYGETGNAFAIPDLWAKSTFEDFEPRVAGFGNGEGVRDLRKNRDKTFASTAAFSSAFSNVDFFSTSFSIEPSKEYDLSLPGLKKFEYGPLEDIESLVSSSICSIAESGDLLESDLEDVWSSPQILSQDHTPTRLKSWEKFCNRTFEEPRTAYVSEGGPCALDVALVLRAERDVKAHQLESPGRVLQSDPMLASLLQLGLGRKSLLFDYVEQDRSFRPHLADGRMSGYTPESFQSLAADFIGYGNNTRNLYLFVDESYRCIKPLQSLIAISDGFSTILSTLQAHLSSPQAPISSLLQIQSKFNRPGLLLSCLDDMMVKTRTARCDEELLSRTCSFVQDMEYKATWLRSIAFELLRHISKPWLESVGAWVGLHRDLILEVDSPSRSFAKLREDVHHDEGCNESHELEYEFVPSSMPSFIANEDAEQIFETGLGLRLLQAHKPEHPFVKPESITSTDPLTLEWNFTWQDAERIQTRVKEYEFNMLEAMKDFDLRGTLGNKTQTESTGTQRGPVETFGVFAETTQGSIRDTLEEFETPLPELDENRNPLSKMVMQCTAFGNETIEEEATILSPPFSLVPSLSFSPILSTQARLINQACLRLLFKEHKIRLHLSLQHRYSFFSDGVFASRLSHALFDPELQTAERRKGYSRSGVSGLKLGSRENWPPASSELRLTLMGILTDSYHHREQAEGSLSRRAELPGGLSFAIRDMSEDELQGCMDPNSIEALDFLRLQYRPPPPLNSVITLSCLAKYDAIFKLLLRAIRMIYVVNQFFRNGMERTSSRNSSSIIIQRFKIEAHHFVSATCGYFFDGVTENWTVFERKLKEIEDCLDRHETIEDGGIHRLRDYHEAVLDRIMFALILRQRQAQVKKLLEEIFSAILKFARCLRNKDSVETGKQETIVEVEEIYQRFKKKVRVFISVCRGLSEKGRSGGLKRNDVDSGLFGNEETDEDGGNTISQLLLKLEMSGYYAKSA